MQGGRGTRFGVMHRTGPLAACGGVRWRNYSQPYRLREKKPRDQSDLHCRKMKNICVEFKRKSTGDRMEWGIDGALTPGRAFCPDKGKDLPGSDCQGGYTSAWDGKKKNGNNINVWVHSLNHARALAKTRRAEMRGRNACSSTAVVVSLPPSSLRWRSPDPCRCPPAACCRPGGA
jgi:hypothetical protein